MYRIILFGDGRPALDRIVEQLAQEGHAVTRAGPEADVAEALGRRRPHLVILDAVSAEARLAAICRSVSETTGPAAVPVLAVVTPAALARLDLPAEVADFLVEGATAAEVHARVGRAVWGPGRQGDHEVVSVGPIAIDHGRHQVLLDGRPVDLTLREYDLLTFLAAHPGRVFSREALLDRVWGLDYLGGTRTVDVHVRRLRVKLDDEFGRLLQTVRGVGYTLKISDAD